MRAPRASTLKKHRTQMQILRTTYMKVIKNYDYMTTMDEKHEFDETNTPFVKKISNVRVFFCTFAFNSITIIAFLDVHTREKQYLSLKYTCILYMLLPQIIPLLTLTLVHTWHEVCTPWVVELDLSRPSLEQVCGVHTLQ